MITATTRTVVDSQGVTWTFVDLVGKQGTTWSLGLTFYRDALRTIPLELTDRLLRGQYRKDYKPATEKLFDFTLTVDDLHSVDNPDGNKVTLFLAPTTSSAVTILSGVYDIELYDPLDETDVERIMQGNLVINPEATK